MEGPEGEVGAGTQMGSALSNVLNACSRWGQAPGVICGGAGGGGWEAIPTGTP